jgi:phosphoribosyl 1,2-cyclic phosphate phosphodiesterase
MEARSIDIRGQMILLGTGTSVGVPTIGCPCEICASATPGSATYNAKNNRTRCGVAVGLPEGNLLIDTPPDLRAQMIREGLGLASAVLYTHEHTDHVIGLDELRMMTFFLGHAIPLYCEETVETRIRKVFDYAFTSIQQTHAGAVPNLEFRRIGLEPFEILGQRIIPIRLKHGPRFDVLGFRIGNVAYCTDTNEIPPESLAQLRGLDVLVLDALREKPHPTHFSLDQAVEVARQLEPRQTYFTHVAHYLDHDETNRKLPPNMNLAYDGQRILLT